MSDQIRLLEDRVGRAADGLRRLREERDRLREQVHTLQHDPGGELGADRAEERAWRATRSEVVAALREAAEALREE